MVWLGRRRLIYGLAGLFDMNADNVYRNVRCEIGVHWATFSSQDRETCGSDDEVIGTSAHLYRPPQAIDDPKWEWDL